MIYSYIIFNYFCLICIYIYFLGRIYRIFHKTLSGYYFSKIIEFKANSQSRHTLEKSYIRERFLSFCD